MLFSEAERAEMERAFRQSVHPSMAPAAAAAAAPAAAADDDEVWSAAV